MNLVLLAFIASWVACASAGYVLRGWVEQERHRTIPEHPAIRGGRVQQQPRLRVITSTQSQPYDYEKEMGG